MGSGQVRINQAESKTGEAENADKAWLGTKDEHLKEVRRDCLSMLFTSGVSELELQGGEGTRKCPMWFFIFI